MRLLEYFVKGDKVMKTLFKVSLIFILVTSLSSDEANILNAIIPDFQVNSDQDSADTGLPTICVDGRGNFVITWADSRNSDTNPRYDTYAQRYSSDGTGLGTNFKVNDSTGNTTVYSGHPSIAADGSGNFIITWKDERSDDGDIYAQRYSMDGTALGSNFKVNDDTANLAQYRPSISADDGGNFIITWSDNRNGISDIYAQRYYSDGTAQGNNFKVNDDQSTSGWGATISADDGENFIITWYAPWDIYAQRYSMDGTALGSNFKVNDDPDISYIGAPSISADNSGNFTITWASIYEGGDIRDIYAQRYSMDGTALGSNFNVNDDQGSAWHERPSISVDSTGNFIITWWMDEHNDNYEIYAQRYLSDGTAVDSNFRVNNIGDGLQRYPNVKLWNNRIYSTWEDNRVDGAVFDIWANVLDWNVVGISNNEQYQALSTFVLHPNYPNPFNPFTTIEFTLPNSEIVTIDVYNIGGQKIQTLLRKKMPAGKHKVEFNGQNFPSGVYLYRIEAGEWTDVKKMILLK